MSKKTVLELIQTVWGERDLSTLSHYWTEDCINHAILGGDNRGLESLQAYHERLLLAFTAFNKIANEIVQQVEEGDTVVTHLITYGKHVGEYYGTPATGRTVTMRSMRIDRFRDGKIAEHWSVSDLAGLIQQLKS